MTTVSSQNRHTTNNAIGFLRASNLPLLFVLLILFVVVQFQYTSENHELAVDLAVREAHLRCSQQQAEGAGEDARAAETTHTIGNIVEEDNTKCCIQCTTPQNECCLLCSDVASPREHDLLMASMEGLTHHVMEVFEAAKHSAAVRQSHGFLTNRAWAGNSHIGNRPAQASYYYDWIRYIQRIEGEESAMHICEIGMNGGHSAVIFLAGLHSGKKDSGVHLTMFDLAAFEYSKTVEKYINALYPKMFTLHVGNSRDTLPKWMEENTKNGVYCDVFSVDGDHTYEGALVDMKNAAKATRKGGYVILDDMSPDGPTRKAFNEVVQNGILGEVRCVEDVHIKVGYDDRIDETNARELKMSWCTAQVV